MNDFIREVKEKLNNLEMTSNGEHIKTIEVRKLSSKLYKELDDKSKENVFNKCSELLEQHNWAMGVIAYDFAYRVRKQYDEDTFSIFESWLIKYVCGWGDCDDFCTHAFGDLIIQKPELIAKIKLWTERKDFWMRRAAAVILIPSIQKDSYGEVYATEIADLLMNDENILVLKGYGWMLKVLSTKKPDKVYNYLVRNKEIMPRVSFRYATEKMDRNMKKELMKL